jgi:hypothetical protein
VKKLNKPRANRDSVKSAAVNVPMTQNLKDKISSKSEATGQSKADICRVILEDFFKKEERL